MCKYNDKLKKLSLIEKSQDSWNHGRNNKI